MAEVGERIAGVVSGRYQVEAEIGRGGMATVYLANDLKHHRKVAMKVLNPELAAAIGGDRFLREIEIAAGLNHPHIMPLLDSGESDGLLYYVMPFMEGETLRERLSRERQLPLAEALQYAREISDALSHAHSRGVIHRDIKPENILLSGGHAVVADFGIARAVHAATEGGTTPAGIAVGTPLYMSPEQAEGRKDVDGRSDLYSLGCLVYEMLAGEPPYTGATAYSIAARQRSDPLRPIATVRPTVPPEVEQAVATLLAPVPADRYQTASQFIAALGTPSGAAPLVARRRPGLWAAAALAILAVGVPVTWRLAASRPLAPRRVVVFPLATSGLIGGDSAFGENLATLLVAALNTSEYLHGIDGWQRLDPGLRANPRLITGEASASIARAAGARYVVAGRAAATGTEQVVVIEVRDLTADSSFSVTARAPRDGGVEVAGLAAARSLLVALVPPARPVDLSALSGRAPAAIVAYLQGEQAYRQFHFAEAFEHFRRAVTADTAFAAAALRGAQTAGWLLRYDAAAQMVRIALAQRDAMPERYVRFADGLQAYFTGQADSAERQLRAAVKLDTSWVDARMQLGEVYRHLLPRDSPLDSLAAAAFDWVTRHEPGFTPAAYHLLEDAVRRGDLARARALERALEAANADSTERGAAALLVSCLRSRRESDVWRDAAKRGLRILTEAAQVLTVAGLHQSACAQAAWQAVLEADTSASGYRWGALVALHSVLTALGRNQEVVRLLSDEPRFASDQRLPLLILSVYAGAPLDAQAAAAADTLRSALARDRTLSSRKAWYLGLWEARMGRPDSAEGLARALDTKADTSGEPLPRLLAGSLRAHAALARGDTSRAMALLDSIVPIGRKDVLLWEPVQSLPADRITLARLFLARRDYRRALQAAAAFDAPAPIAYAAFVPASLAIRFRAAQALGLNQARERYRTRLEALGRAQLATTTTGP